MSSMLQFFIDLYYVEQVLEGDRSPESYLKLHRDSATYRSITFGQQERVHDITIMIPALESRSAYHSILADELTRQGLSFQFNYTEGITIGEKREIMYKECPTQYCIQLDDDDWISHDFGYKLRNALKTNPSVDVIVYNELVFIDKNPPTFTLWGLEFDIGRTQEGFFVFSPGPKMCIETDIARQIKIPHINKGEDMAFRESIKNLLETQVRLPGWSITYEYTSKGTTTNSQEGVIVW